MMDAEPDRTAPRGPLRLIAAALLLIAAMVVPFALKAGAEFFLPVTAATIIAVALVPVLEGLERRGVASPLAALLALLLFLIVLNGALALVVVPAMDWFAALPDRLPQIQANLSPILDLYAELQRFADRVVDELAAGSRREAAALAPNTPGNIVELITSRAPGVAIQLFFALLLIYFYLAGWTRLRRGTITRRGDFDSALATARLIQRVIDATSAYLATITIINLSLGLAVAVVLWALGLPSPLMWGGIVALCNFVPYLGPIVAAVLLGVGGLMTFDAVGLALLPTAVFVGLHLLEANILTPMVVGRRLTVSPVLILLSLSFWGWVWGATGALLAVPILVILQTIVQATGVPGAGLLFGSPPAPTGGRTEPRTVVEPEPAKSG